MYLQPAWSHPPLLEMAFGAGPTQQWVFLLLEVRGLIDSSLDSGGSGLGIIRNREIPRRSLQYIPSEQTGAELFGQ